MQCQCAWCREDFEYRCKKCKKKLPTPDAYHVHSTPNRIDHGIKVWNWRWTANVPKRVHKNISGVNRDRGD